MFIFLSEEQHAFRWVPSLRKADAAKQVGKARVAAQWVKNRPILKRSHKRGSLRARFFQPLKGFILITKRRMDEGDCT
jgi:hypothetical protein